MFNMEKRYRNKVIVIIISSTLNSGTSPTDLALDSRIQERKKAKTSVPTISQSLQVIWMEFGMLLRLVSLMILILILSHPFNIQGRKPYLCGFVKKKTL